MRCSDVHVRLGERGAQLDAELDAELREHLRICTACAALAEAGPLPQLLHSDRAPGADAADLDAIWSCTRDALAREDRLSRALSHAPTAQRIAVLLMAAVGMLGFIMVGMPRPDMSEQLGVWLGTSLVASLAVLGAAVWLGYRPIHRPELPRWVYGAVLGAALVTAWFPVFMAPAAAHDPSAAAPALSSAVGCFVWGNVFGVVLLGMLLLGLRGERRLSALPLAVFIAGGTFGVTALNMHCSIVDAGHLALGHSMVLTLLVLVPPLARLRG